MEMSDFRKAYNFYFQVEFLEKERANLQSQSESQTKLQNSQVNALEAVCGLEDYILQQGPVFGLTQFCQ